MLGERLVARAPNMATGVVLLVLGVLVNAASFFVLRAIAARAAGVRGVLPVLAIDNRPWAGVSFARRAAFVAAGPLGCYLAAAVLMTTGLVVGGEPSIDETSMRVRVTPNGAAAAAGIQDDDRIVSVHGVGIRDWDQLKAAIRPHAGEPVAVLIERRGIELTFTPTPSADGKIGVGPPLEVRKVGLGPAIVSGFLGPMRTWSNATRSWARMASKTEPVEVSGPVGIATATGEASAQSLGPALKLVGMLSAYFLWFPMILALVLFPRPSRR